ncbi:MAG: glucohydrolase, partial [Bacillota bacterium]
FMENGASHETAMQALRDRSRDNARSPMQWDSSKYAGFSNVEPWMPVNGNHTGINVETESKKEDSVLKTYQWLLRLRKEQALAHGELKFHALKDPQLFMYETSGDVHDYLVVANFKKPKTAFTFERLEDYTLIATNMETVNDSTTLEAYEARIYRKDK